MYGVRNKMLCQSSADFNYAVSQLPSSSYNVGVETGSNNCKGCPYCLGSTFEFVMVRWVLMGTNLYETELAALNYCDSVSSIIEMEVFDPDVICCRNSTIPPNCPMPRPCSV